MEMKDVVNQDELNKYVCKYCGSDDLSYIPDWSGFGPYIYHYSLDYELGCHQRISGDKINSLEKKKKGKSP